MKKIPIVAIVGRTNVGKSSLLNAVVGQRQAIVAKEAGTTRDSVWSLATHKGKNFWLVDTAGVKDPQDAFEATIQEQIAEAADIADAIWVVIEAHTLITNEDHRLATQALKTKKPVTLVVNKMDKKPAAKPSDYKKLGIKNIFLTSASQRQGLDELLDNLISDIPGVKAGVKPSTITLALLGRPNVGKSSLFNRLAKKQQALVAKRAGTTRDTNKITLRYEKKDIEIVDTAGIRRQGKIERGVEKFSVLRSLAAIQQADICLLLMDANELNVQLDQRIAGLVKEANKGLILVVTKWDSVDKDPQTQSILAAQIANNYAFVPWAPLIFTSSVTGQNVTKLFELALEINKSRRTRIKTPELNRWFNSCIRNHPPAGLKNQHPKLNYIVQEFDSPTNFKIFGHKTKYLHWSYKRYLEKELRKQFGFDGTGIKFWYFDQ